MKKQSMKDLLHKWPLQLKSIVKDIYNQIHDVRVLSIDEVEVTDDEFKKIMDLVTKVNNGEDITFDIGYRYFRNNKLKLKEGVFVPQYDTEQIIDILLSKNIEGRFLEIGTGTGAIPISIIKETRLSGVTIDINNEATLLAKENYLSNVKEDDGRLEFINGDFFDYRSEEKYDLIISNPPYIDYEDKYVDDWVKANQPKEALYADDNGLKFYKDIFLRVKDLLVDNGYIIVEIGFDQGEVLKTLASEISNEVEVIKDYEQHDRFIVVRYNGK